MEALNIAAWQRKLLDRLLLGRQLPLAQYLAARDQVAEPGRVETCRWHSDRVALSYDADGQPLCAACLASERKL